ncbi:MFS transporter [Sporomusa sp.]|uniref:MFS transporter n=1 Tax=Sporomusa sp. TaxID=2078658 RepID=UPI002B6871D7|nr:MFS transporter [Sporomusa sp.]HWR08695.1 MFS transporter [Sporomusa sp.]
MVSSDGTRKTLLKGALLFSSVDGMVASALLVPILANIAKDFPDAGPWLNQLLSLPSLLMIPAIIITGKLADYVSKKTLLMIGTILFTAGGFGGIFANNIMDLVWTRALLGIGAGIVYPMAPAMIAYLYQGQERAQMLGWTNACGSVFSFVLGIGAGYAALFHWKYAFYFYLIFVLVFLMQWAMLPDFPPEKKDDKIAQAKVQSNPHKKLGYRVWLTSFDMIVYMTLSMVLLYKLSLFIVSEHLGTSADVGLATSIQTLASFLISLVFSQVLKRLKRFTAVLGLACMASGYFFFGIADNFSLVVVAAICLGLSLGIIFPYLMNRVSSVAPNSKKTLAISLLSMSIYIGQYLSAFFTQFADWVSHSSIRGTFTFVASVLAVCVIIAVVYILATQGRDRNVSMVVK